MTSTLAQQDIYNDWLQAGEKYGVEWLRQQYRVMVYAYKNDSGLSETERAAMPYSLKCVIAAGKAVQKQADQPEASFKAPVSSDGMYRHPKSGVIYKVQYNKGEGDGRRLYAKKLVVLEPATYNEDGTVKKTAVIKFVYAKGAVYRLDASMKMTKDQAKAFGALYGTCVRCGRDLTLEESIDRMMGRTCYGKMGW